MHILTDNSNFLLHIRGWTALNILKIFGIYSYITYKIKGIFYKIESQIQLNNNTLLNDLYKYYNLLQK